LQIRKPNVEVVRPRELGQWDQWERGALFRASKGAFVQSREERKD